MRKPFFVGIQLVTDIPDGYSLSIRDMRVKLFIPYAYCNTIMNISNDWLLTDEC